MDRLASVNLEPSSSTEELLMKLGALLGSSLIRSQRLDEVEILMDAIAEYSTMVSYYGESTNRIPESLGVDLMEAAMLKRDEMTAAVKTEWHIYASQFEGALADLADELGIKLSETEK